MNGESDFEYDGEDSEAGDEGFEADESTWEASDEDVEADEGTDEGDEASDEGEDIGEAIEAADEGDGEADEAVDEAVMSASARLRADRDRNRRADWARRIAADQRLDAQRAASTQRAITDRLRSIKVGGRPGVSTVGSLQGAGVVTAILPNGRRSRMRIIPTMAPISEVNRLRSVVVTNGRRQATATASNTKAITALAVAQASAVKKLTDQQLKSDRDLGKRIVEGDNRLDRRITKELSGGSGVLDKHGKKMLRALRRERTRSVMDSVLLASAMPFYAAYGDREDPFARNNLILTGSLLFWLLGDEAIDWFAGKSDALKGLATAWSYGAFAGNGATAYFFLNGKQHERYVSGLADVPDAGFLDVPITDPKIGKDALDDFKKDKHVVVATILSSAASATATDVRADLTNGVLRLTVDPKPAAGSSVKVAYIIDTAATP